MSRNAMRTRLVLQAIDASMSRRQDGSHVGSSSDHRRPSPSERVILRLHIARLLVGAAFCLAVPDVAVAAEGVLIARPDAFKTLVNPPCSYCVTEAKRRVETR